MASGRPHQEVSGHHSGFIPSKNQGPPTNPWSETGSGQPWIEIDPNQSTETSPTTPTWSIKRKEVPAALRPGLVAGRRSSEEHDPWNKGSTEPESDLTTTPSILQPGGRRAETNPFLRKDMSSDNPPTNTLSNLNISGESSNPWQSATTNSREMSGSGGQLLRSDTRSEESEEKLLPTVLIVDEDGWTQHPDSPENPPPPQQARPAVPSHALNLIGSGEETAWTNLSNSKDNRSQASPPKATTMQIVSDEFVDEQHVWDDVGEHTGKGKGKAGRVPAMERSDSDDWNLIDSDPEDEAGSSDKIPATSEIQTKLSQQPQSGDFLGGGEQLPPADYTQTIPPLPSREHSGQQPRWVPSRQAIDGSAETYQIKNVRWLDHTAKKNSRTSPILVQNANGPCPLVALVNALTLTTPSDAEETALVQVLRSREQVSLNLLLDAVFDELMSPRRTNSEAALPDVGDLYTFLQSLHTGMNVNPRFIPSPEVAQAYQTSSLTHLDPSERGSLIPGTFENTGEMALYATFSIPLIHGWLPRRDDNVFESLERQAVSYEDVQNLLFREEELEEKLSHSDEGLSEQEQQLYHDIIIIREFLGMSATQLTPWGIEVIGRAMRPGTFAILFRNDHFCTLYCHPETRQLLILVTDAGYKSHDEIVWESLADVNGVRSEFLSGDFRSVSGSSTEGPNSHMDGSYAHDQSGSWTTVQGKRGKPNKSLPEPPQSSVASGEPSSAAGFSHYEQEDRDLALAMQLQEEEDQRHRESEARRQRESELSEQFIEQQGRSPPAGAGERGGRSRTSQGSAPGLNNSGTGIAPQRRSSNNISIPITDSPRQRTGPAQEIRPLLPPRQQGLINRQTDTGDEPPPPPYEHAQNQKAYIPPVGHPSHSTTGLDLSQQNTNASSQRGQPSSPNPTASYPSASAGRGQQPAGQRSDLRPGGTGRRPLGGGGSSIGGSSSQSRDKDCVVM